MWWYLRLFGVAEDPLQRSKTSITVKNFRIGGKDSGKQLLNSLLRVLYLTISSTTLVTLKEAFSHANSLNGPKSSKPLISIQEEETS